MKKRYILIGKKIGIGEGGKVSMKKEMSFARDLIEFLDKSPCAFFAVEEMKRRLQEKGYRELQEREAWKLEKNGKYYVTKNNSAILAFQVGSGEIEEEGFHIIGSHSDSPCFRVKHNPEMSVEGKYLKLNTEVYGGPILSTWFDRALSLAGRVTIKGKDAFHPKSMFVNIEEDFMTIPNLCIHMNRGVNDGMSWNAQKDTLPFLGTLQEGMEAGGLLQQKIADLLAVKTEDILGMDLFVYDREQAKIVGMKQEFVQSGRIDNLGMAHAGLEALLSSKKSKVCKVVLVSDNEEVGSMTKQGANSPFLKNTLRRIVLSLGKGEEEFMRALANSFLISSDQAHALHPNYTEKQDLTNRPVLNGGVAIKIAANQAYTSDAHSIAVFVGICQKAKQKYQFFHNRSDMKGGSTIGPITTTQIDIPSVDIGNPILSMHSVRELLGIRDHYSLYRIFQEFYK